MKRAVVFMFIVVFLTLFVAGFASAGLGDWFDKITGRVTQQNVNVNVSITNALPIITFVSNISAVNLNEGPTSTDVFVNFTAFDSNGAADLNDSSAMINFTKSGEAVRMNSSCAKIASAGNNSNYTCFVNLYWFDAAGTWGVNAFIRDSSGFGAENTSTSFTVNALTGFSSGPSSLLWNSLSSGAVNQTSSNDPILMNNTGNQNITSGNVMLNTTNLLGEVDFSKGIYANNFSVSTLTGGSPPAECAGTTMSKSVFAGISGATLPRGNFTINDNSTGQEEIYFCIKLIGAELTQQSYSTANQGAWTLKIS